MKAVCWFSGRTLATTSSPQKRRSSQQFVALLRQSATSTGLDAGLRASDFSKSRMGSHYDEPMFWTDLLDEAESKRRGNTDGSPLWSGNRIGKFPKAGHGVGSDRRRSRQSRRRLKTSAELSTTSVKLMPRLSSIAGFGFGLVFVNPVPRRSTGILHDSPAPLAERLD